MEDRRSRTRPKGRLRVPDALWLKKAVNNADGYLALAEGYGGDTGDNYRFLWLTYGGVGL
jgi:hypothetical protein